MKNICDVENVYFYTSIFMVHRMHYYDLFNNF